jgi:hypothetical protein
MGRWSVPTFGAKREHLEADAIRVVSYAGTRKLCPGWTLNDAKKNFTRPVFDFSDSEGVHCFGASTPDHQDLAEASPTEYSTVSGFPGVSSLSQQEFARCVTS